MCELQAFVPLTQAQYVLFYRTRQFQTTKPMQWQKRIKEKYVHVHVHIHIYIQYSIVYYLRCAPLPLLNTQLKLTNCNDFYNKSMYSFVIHKEKNGFFNFTKFVTNIIDKQHSPHKCGLLFLQYYALIYAETMKQSAGLLPQITRLFTE